MNAGIIYRSKLPPIIFLTRRFLSVNDFNNRNSITPIIEKYRSIWPDVEYNRPLRSQSVMPKRTIPDSALKFRFRATFDHNSTIFYPHLNHNPADFKVILEVFYLRLSIDFLKGIYR